MLRPWPVWTRRQLRAGETVHMQQARYRARGLGLGGTQGSRRTREFVVRGDFHVAFEPNEVEVGVARSGGARTEVGVARCSQSVSGHEPETKRQEAGR